MKGSAQNTTDASWVGFPWAEQLAMSPDAMVRGRVAAKGPMQSHNQSTATGLPALLQHLTTRTGDILSRPNQLPELMPALRKQVGRAAVQEGTVACQVKQPPGVKVRRPQVPSLIWAFPMWQTSRERCARLETLPRNLELTFQATSLLQPAQITARKSLCNTLLPENWEL